MRVRSADEPSELLPDNLGAARVDAHADSRAQAHALTERRALVSGAPPVTGDRAAGDPGVSAECNTANF